MSTAYVTFLELAFLQSTSRLFFVYVTPKWPLRVNIPTQSFKCFLVSLLLAPFPDNSDLLQVYQHNETNVMHFLFNLLRIKGLYMFRALRVLAHPQEVLHKRHFVYCVRIMFVAVATETVPQPTDIIRTQYTKCRLWAPPEDEHAMLETCRGPWFSINWMKSVLRWFHYADILWCTVSNT
jgi:hypothetical protein